MKKVYLMIYDLGGGHRSTANALQKIIEKRNLPWEIHIVDAFKEIIGMTAPQDVYNNLILKKNWAKIISEPLLVPLFKLQIRLWHFAWLARFKKYWQQHQPDIVVSLLPYINRLLYESLQAVSPNIPFVTLPIDFADCPPNFWIESQKQFLICPTERMVEQAQKLGYQKEQIFPISGMVINPQIYEPITVNCQVERQRLGLEPNLPTALIMFGGYGSNAMIEIAQCLEQSSLKIQLIFICGRNEKLANILRHSQSRLPRYVENFTNEISYYMYLSDFFIGKPGPGSLSEAVAMKLPVITECNALTLFQERASTQWLVNHEFGIVVDHFRDIKTAVAELIQPENLARYRANVAAYKNRAVFEVADILESIIKNSFSSVTLSPNVDICNQLSSTV